MGTHLSKADRSRGDADHQHHQNGEIKTGAAGKHPNPKSKLPHLPHLKDKKKALQEKALHEVPQLKEKKKALHRHNTVAEMNGAETNHQQLFRHASYGDFRHQFHDDLKSVSKRFSQVLGRSESLREDKDLVIYKHDFRTKYLCNMASPLSHGRYATVTAAESFLTAQDVAVKIIRKDKLFDKKSGKRCAGENVRVEVLALRNLSNEENVVKFFEVYEDETFFYVVMELCRGGNLLERINKAGPMKEEQAGPLLKQMLTVTKRCHSRGIAHRDLKLENFVFLSDTEDYPLNLVDFGSAAFFKSGESRPFKGAVGTFNYMAPEVYDSRYGPSADVWSLGIIGYALLCSYLPYSASSDEELREMIKNEDIPFSHAGWENVSEDAKDLLKRMLEKNPDFRITTAEALAHPWLKQWEFKKGYDQSWE